MAPVTLPPSFFNSFWSPDYRSGLEVLFKQLEGGCEENSDIVAFIESQARGHQSLADTLLTPPISTGATTSSLQHSLLSLRGASSARGQAHQDLADELGSKVLGFKQWKDKHESRVQMGREEILSKTGLIALWEKDVQRLMTLKQTHLVKARAADDSEDDAKFAPATAPASAPAPSGPAAAASPVSPSSAGSNLTGGALRRSGTVADRINAKLRDARVTSTATLPISIEGKELPPPPSPTPPIDYGSPSSPTREESFIPPTDPHGKPTINGSSAPSKLQTDKESLPPQPILLSGLALHAQALQDLLGRFSAYLLTTPAPYADSSNQQYTKSNAARVTRQRSNLLGTHEKTFSGEEVVQWLRDNVEGFGGDYERCLDAAEELYRMGHIARIGVGRGFDPAYDTYYTLKLKLGSGPTFTSPLSPTANANIQSMMKNLIPAGLGSTDDEPQHIKLRREATKADEAYREAVDVVEERRLEMEERIERGLRIWERWERERLSIVKAVLNQYGDAIAQHAPRISGLTESTALSVEAFNPEADIKALIEGNRTGPFRPQPHTYESIDMPDVNFGIDLRRWSGELGWKGMMNAPQRAKGAIPEVLETLLRCLRDMYEQLPDEERRKSWIYEVPLVETHALRSRINKSHTSKEELESAIKQFNVPVVAGTIKLYMLELNPPVMGWEGWEDAKAVYPQIGADQERDVTSALTSVLTRLPSIHLYVLDAIVKHFVDLIDNTQSEEPKDNYITKLALSVGRCVLRPQYENELTIGDRTPSLFLADLIKNYAALLPPLVEKKKKDAERIMPVRKRTALVDQRISRSQLGAGAPPVPGLGLGALGAPVLEEPEEAPLPPKPTLARPTEKTSERPKVETRPGPPVGMPSPPDSPTEEPFIPPADPEEDLEPSFIPPAEEQEVVYSPIDQSIPSPVDSTVGGLKRATSGETSRLRGPRGARGPRPAPGRVPSSTTVPSGAADDGPSQSDGEAKSGGGLKRGSRVHKAGNSVSQAIANFEGRN